MAFWLRRLAAGALVVAIYALWPTAPALIIGALIFVLSLVLDILLTLLRSNRTRVSNNSH